MAKIDISTLKTKFESGDRPTQADYIDLIDTLAANSRDLGSNGNNDNVISGIENPTVIESVDASEWRLLKYLVSIANTSSGVNKYYATELTILIDGTDVHVSEYGIIDNDGDVGTVDVSRTGDMLQVVVTPNPSVRPITVRFARMGLRS